MTPRKTICSRIGGLVVLSVCLLSCQRARYEILHDEAYEEMKRGHLEEAETKLRSSIRLVENSMIGSLLHSLDLSSSYELLGVVLLKKEEYAEGRDALLYAFELRGLSTVEIGDQEVLGRLGVGEALAGNCESAVQRCSELLSLRDAEKDQHAREQKEIWLRTEYQYCAEIVRDCDRFRHAQFGQAIFP